MRQRQAVSLASTHTKMLIFCGWRRQARFGRDKSSRRCVLRNRQHMKPIQMVDLQGQYERVKAEIDEALLATVRSAKFINGPEVAAFEERLAEYLSW